VPEIQRTLDRLEPLRRLSRSVKRELADETGRLEAFLAD
jgi:hypothetical protein